MQLDDVETMGLLFASLGKIAKLNAAQQGELKQTGERFATSVRSLLASQQTVQHLASQVHGAVVQTSPSEAVDAALPPFAGELRMLLTYLLLRTPSEKPANLMRQLVARVREKWGQLDDDSPLNGVSDELIQERLLQTVFCPRHGKALCPADLKSKYMDSLRDMYAALVSDEVDRRFANDSDTVGQLKTWDDMPQAARTKFLDDIRASINGHATETQGNISDDDFAVVQVKWVS